MDTISETVTADDVFYLIAFVRLVDAWRRIPIVDEMFPTYRDLVDSECKRLLGRPWAKPSTMEPVGNPTLSDVANVVPSHASPGG